MCHSLFHQSLIRSWDQGFCQALGFASDQSSLSSSSPTTELLQRLFPPLLDALREPRSGLLLCQPSGPVPLALGLCTLQTTLLWFWGKAQQHLASWAPGSFLPLIQKDLPVSSWGWGGEQPRLGSDLTPCLCQSLYYTRQKLCLAWQQRKAWPWKWNSSWAWRSGS